MKPSELFEALHALISERVPVHIWGACGVGKTQIGAQVAADRKCEYCTSGPCSLIPFNLRGLPYIAADRAEWVPPKFLPLSGEGIGELEGNKSGRLRVPFVNQPVECLRNREELRMPRNESISTVDSAQCAR